MAHILAVDLDEVLSESLDEILKFHNYKFKGLPIIKSDFSNHYMWHIPKYNVSVDEGIQYFSEVLQSDSHDLIKPVAGAKEKLLSLKQKGWKIVILTARIDEMKAITLSWLHTHFDGLFDDVIFANHFTDKSQSKSEICKELGIEIMIEDSLDYAIDLAQAGIKVYLLDKPWNQAYDPNIHIGVTKISSWDELDI